MSRIVLSLLLFLLCAAPTIAEEPTAKTRPNITLSLLEDDHQLIASLPRIWNDVQPFLGLTE